MVKVVNPMISTSYQKNGSPEFTFSIDKLIDFYARKDGAIFSPSSSESIGFTETNAGSHVSAITGLIGEDLLIALFAHFLVGTNTISNPQVEYKCKSGYGKKQLDGKVLSDSSKCSPSNFQIEVKNWSAHSYKAKQFDVTKESDVLECARYYYEHNYKSVFSEGEWKKHIPISKVMFLHGENKINIYRAALLVFLPISESSNESFRKIEIDYTIPGYDLVRSVLIFSGLQYLLKLKRTSPGSITLAMPRAAERLRLIAALQEAPS